MTRITIGGLVVILHDPTNIHITDAIRYGLWIESNVTNKANA